MCAVHLEKGRNLPLSSHINFFIFLAVFNVVLIYSG